MTAATRTPIPVDDPEHVLTAARELVSDPERWAQGDFARDADGRGFLFGYGGDGREPVCWCINGAVEFVTGVSVFGQPAHQCLQAALMRIGWHDDHVANYQDEHSHVEALALMDVAIVVAREGADV